MDRLFDPHELIGVHQCTDKVGVWVIGISGVCAIGNKDGQRQLASVCQTEFEFESMTMECG